MAATTRGRKVILLEDLLLRGSRSSARIPSSGMSTVWNFLSAYPRRDQQSEGLDVQSPLLPDSQQWVWQPHVPGRREASARSWLGSQSPHRARARQGLPSLWQDAGDKRAGSFG